MCSDPSHARARLAFHGLFCGLRNFRCKTVQFFETPCVRRTTKLPGVSNDMQSSETLRNSLGSDYKSAALTSSVMPALERWNATRVTKLKRKRQKAIASSGAVGLSSGLGLSHRFAPRRTIRIADAPLRSQPRFGLILILVSGFRYSIQKAYRASQEAMCVRR